MRPAAGRFLLTALLFVGWLGYLGYLVATRPQTADGRPLVLSGPQLLVSELDVIARVDDPAKPVLVQKVLYPPKEKQIRPGDMIRVSNLGQCRPLTRDPGQKPTSDWTAPGEYLLPLQRWTENGQMHYQVTPTPASPGYPSPRNHQPGPPRIYPATPGALAQYEQIRKPG